MIINHALQFVYVAPPKTASTSLHYWLTQPAFLEAGSRRFCPAVDFSGQHDTDIPKQCQGYFVFATVRNPYARAVSLWQHASNQKLPVVLFDSFLEAVSRHGLGWFYSRSQADHLAGLRLDAVIDCELPAIGLIRKVPFVQQMLEAVSLEKVPYMNTTVHKGWSYYYVDRPDRAERVRGLWGEDFALGNYSTTIPDSWEQ